MSVAKSKFDRTINRSKRLIKQYKTFKGLDLPASKDMLRASIVLSVAAIDAYVTDVFIELFIPFIQENDINDNMCELLESKGFNLKSSLSLLKNDDPFSELKQIIEGYLEKHTTQKADRIDGLFDTYCLSNITFNAAKKMSDNPKKLLNDFNEIVQRRHKIVHDGDYNKSQSINDVSEKDIEKIDAIVTIVSGIEFILTNKFKEYFESFAESEDNQNDEND